MPDCVWFLLSIVAVSLICENVNAQTRITTTGRVYKPAPVQEAESAPDGRATDTSEGTTNNSPKTEDESARDGVLLDKTKPEQTASVDDSEEEKQVVQTDDKGQLNLVCFGGGAANKSTVGTVNAWNNYGGYAGATVIGQRSQGFADEVRIRLNDQDPRLRMPRSMLPVIRGGKNGWFKLKSIKYGEGEITASIAVSMFNNPKLRLDRYTGGISISGKAGDFTGECQRFDPDAVEKAF